MGTIKCGFWVCKFIVTPDEFADFVNECERKYKSTFIHQTYSCPQHTAKEVSERYNRLYANFVGKTKPVGMGGVAHEMGIVTDKDSSSFALMGNEFMFWINSELVKLFGVRIEYPKGYAVICEDDETKFEYADITKREPTIYPVFQELEAGIKAITKPLRFVSLESGKMIKLTGVRISENAAKDLASSWIFDNYKLEMKSWSKRSA
ncbi:MAG: hypothetical protein LBI31_05165 [Zoogloeaceae bacterium]|nr:hypothetical protein [Zoogloeaceae bacterium]